MNNWLACALLACVACTAMADEPLAPPSRKVTCSASGEFCATANPATQVTTVSRRGESVPLWTIPGWQRWVLVANDGQRAVAGYGGLNLVPKDMPMTGTVLVIYGPSGLVKSVRLGDLYQRRDQMVETVSHYEWENGVSLDARDRLVVELVDGTKVNFDVATGERLGP